MKYLSKLLFIVFAALGIVACADIFEVVSPCDEQTDGDMPVNISFNFTDRSIPTRSMVSGTETKVKKMQLVCFDANGLYLGIRNAEVTNDNPTATGFYDSGIIKGTVPQGTSRIHFIANRYLDIPLSHNVGTAEETVMKSLELSTAYDDTNENHLLVCYWGYHKEANASAMNEWLNPTDTPSEVYLIRDRAKIILKYDKTDAPFKVQEIKWLIHNGRKRGYLAPKSADWESYCRDTTITVDGTSSTYKLSKAGMNEYTADGRYTLYDEEEGINEDGNFDVAYDGNNNTLTPQFLFEDDNTALKDTYPKIILKVTYEVNSSTKTVYHVLKLKDTDDNQYDIVRNNTYYITCKLLSPDIAYYESLKAAINGEAFMDGELEIDRSITEVNDDNYTLQILLPTETTSIVLNQEGENTDMQFAFRNLDLTEVEGTTTPVDNITAFNVYWEKAQTFCTDPTVTYNSSTKQYTIHTTVKDGQLSDKLQSEWLVVEYSYTGSDNKTHKLTRYIHVFVIDQFRYKLYPKLTRVGTGTYGDCLLTFQLPPVEHSQFQEDGSPDPNELVYPQELYPIDVKFTTNTLNAYGITQNVNNYGLFGVSVESTEILTNRDKFEVGYGSLATDGHPISTTNTQNISNWYFQQENNYWDFWYTYSLKTYPTNGVVNIYFKDVRQNIKYATVADVGLFLYVEYFGKNYSVPLSAN